MGTEKSKGKDLVIAAMKHNSTEVRWGSLMRIYDVGGGPR
jgi:hypothetical protein